MKVRFAFYLIQPETRPIPFYAVDLEPGKAGYLTDEALADRWIPIPPTPTLNTWKMMVGRRERCGFCWQTLNGSLEALHDHVSQHHAERVA